jgi:excisionase family DNA binding protein
MTNDRPYTVAGLAVHWGCSDQFIYDLVKAGKLRALRLGPRLIRIEQEAVIDYEARSVEVVPEAPAPDGRSSADEARERRQDLAREMRRDARWEKQGIAAAIKRKGGL